MSVATGVIGAGYWGKNLIRNLHELGALSAICDTDAGARERFARHYPGVRIHENADSLLTDNAIQAVAIATPADTHGVLARASLEAGKHAFVEKPLCLDLAEAHDLAALASARNRVLMVGHLLLYHPAFIALKSGVENGDIGRLRYIYSTRASLGQIRRSENALWSFAPHDISMILALTARMPLRVSCNGEAWLSPTVADLTLSHFDFGEQLQAHIFVSWLHPYKDHRLVVVGEEGMIVFNDTLAGDQKLLRYPHSVGWDGDLPYLDKAEAVPIPFGAEEPLRQEMTHFLECCVAGRQPRSDAVEGANVLMLLDACQRALDSRAPVSMDGERRA